MTPDRQAEYEFFLRASALFESRATELERMDNVAAQHLAKQAVEDARNAQLWAERIKAGWTVRPGEEQAR